MAREIDEAADRNPDMDHKPRILGNRRLLQLAATLVGGVTVLLLLFLVAFAAVVEPAAGLFLVIPLAALVALLVLGWRRPHGAGLILVIVGGTIAAFMLLSMLFFADVQLSLSEVLGATVFLAPPIVAGLLFLRASRAG